MRAIALILLILLCYLVIWGGISAPRWITLFRGQHRRAFSGQVIRQECRKVSFTDAVGHFGIDIRPLPFGMALTVQRHEIVPAQDLGQQPLPFSKRSASLAISPFFR
jgi:hypothetical protein